MILFALVLFEAVSLACWLLIPFFPSVFNTDGQGVVAVVLSSETSLFYSSAVLAPVFVALMLFSWVLAVLVWLGRAYGQRGAKRVHFAFSVGRRRLDLGKQFARFNAALRSVFEPVDESSKRRWLVLALSVVLAFSVAVYPYLPGVNPTGRTVGADTKVYSEWLTSMDERGGSLSAFSYAFHNVSDRFLGLFMMYLGWKVLPVTSLQFVQFLPALLGPLLVLAAFFFMRKAGFNSWAASTASLFTAFSFHIAVGVFAGFLSNWIGLLFLYLSLGFLFWSLRRHSWSLLLAAGILQVALLFSHSFTWLMYMGVLGVFSLLLLMKRLRGRSGGWELKMLVVALVMNVVAYVARNSVLSAGPTSVGVSEVFQQDVSLRFTQYFWAILSRSVSAEMGISFLNPNLFFLALLGAFAFVLSDKQVSRFLSAALAASAAPFIIGDWVVQTRILYDLPVQVLSFMGCVVMLKLLEAFFDVREAKRLGQLVLILVVLANLNFAFRCSFQLS